MTKKINNIDLTNPVDDYQDILIVLTNNDGKTIKVKIPQEIFDWELKEYHVFGLNLVSMGHYQ
jgi:hypothetical protein